MRDQPQELSRIVGSARGILDRADPSAKLSSPAFRYRMADEGAECCFSPRTGGTHKTARAVISFGGEGDHLCRSLFHRSLLGMNRSSHVRRMLDKRNHWS